jgi:hypothetical protein
MFLKTSERKALQLNNKLMFLKTSDREALQLNNKLMFLKTSEILEHQNKKYCKYIFYSVFDSVLPGCRRHGHFSQMW